MELVPDFVNYVLIPFPLGKVCKYFLKDYRRNLVWQKSVIT